MSRDWRTCPGYPKLPKLHELMAWLEVTDMQISWGNDSVDLTDWLNPNFRDVYYVSDGYGHVTEVVEHS